MTLSVNYDAAFASSTVDDYLAFWSAGFVTAGHGYSNTGGFSNGTFDGDQYATHGRNNSDYAFIADSDSANGLHYVFDPSKAPGDNLNHYLWGSLDNVSLGEVLGGGSGSDFSLGNYVVSFNGLDLDAAQGAGRAGNEVQGVIYGLMQGNTSALEGVLDNLLAGYGVSTNNTFAEIGAALAAGPAHAAAAEAVGVQALPEDLALAA
ncbi:heme acquisition protein HasA [Pseudomonas mosselii]|uniref:heme acquisition protein HasA n=1 Tax=Pseudomonas mosselii TaxID=78327 RepID=UPI00077064E2|nr:heme acquisition protein HasA [Pseudomonas mosselii]AMK32979.1 Hemophore HasA [Pseudomonas putida]ATB66134.1 heme-binding protein [Pseudomonas mosselii]KXG81103.1 heme-binding protein [Pseudomonas mosselii]MBC3453836.1 heme-binding protein [Pseudomonas mosselii]MDH1102103.1 heme acquisition protein HasA [Pseudomonas mosselii]